MAAPTNGAPRAPASREITIVHDALPKFEKKVKHLRTSLTTGETGPTGIDVEDFLDWVMGERLRRIPHQGGRWDRVLKWAEYFTSQVSHFEQTVHGFLAGSLEASRLVFVCCRALLEMGPSQAHALERAFRIMYEQAVVLSFFIRHSDMFEVSEVRPELGHAYVSLIQLVVDITVYYNRRAKDSKSSAVTVNFQALFGRTIQAFFRRKDNVSNAMWTYQLRRSSETQNLTVEIATIRAWLGAASSGLPVSISNPKSERAEFSCEWFQPHLADFIRSKDDILSIEGASGSGKSVLVSWIIERLQRPLNRRYIEPISYFLDANVPTQSTPLNLVKGLLVQLLEKHVGDVELYKSLVDVYDLSMRSGSSFEIEERLWEVLDHAVKNASDMVIIVDGVNEAAGPKDAPTRVFERLHNLAAKYFGVRVITGAQSIPTKYPKTKHFTITPQHTRTDIYNLARLFLTSRGHIHEDDESLEKAAEQISQRSEGSFVTANLLLYLLARETSKESMLAAINKSQKLDGILTTLIEKAVHNPVVKTVLSWLLVAENNLTVDDIRILLGVDISKGSRTNYNGDVREDLLSACDSLVVVQDGLVRYRHLSISEHLRHLSKDGKVLLSPQDAHTDFLTRILLHIKLSINRDEQPGTDELETALVDELYHDIPLLQYTVRHWTTHFKHTTMWKESGTYTFTAEFKRAFPNVAIFPLLEKTTWETALSLTEVSVWHKLALTIRETVLGKFEASVLQSYLNVATIYQKTGHTSEATQYYYSAFTISKTVVGEHSSLTAFFAETYLELVSSVKSTKRDTLVDHKEDTLKYMVKHSVHEHEESSEDVLKYKKSLADLYMSVSETTKASGIYREVYDATVARYGVSSKETTEVSRDLTTVLEKEQKRDEIVQYTRPVFEQAESTMAVDDSRRVTATLQMAETYESQKDFAKAEELYVMMWQRLSEHAATKKTNEAHIQVIEAVLSYTRFLRRQGRKQEAQATLIGISSEYEHTEIKSDAVASKLTVVGKELRELGVASVAVSIFASLWSYFKKTNRQSSKEAADVAIQLTNTAKDVPDQAVSKSYTSVLMEVFQASFASKSVTVDSTTIHTCQTLSTYHVQSGHWAEAAEICSKLLVNLWTGLSTLKKPAKFPEEHAQEATELAMREAHCRWKLSQLDKAEHLYLYIFEAAKSSMKIDDTRVTELTKSIIEFYKTTHQTEKLTKFYEELLVSYRKSLGVANKTTIATLYSLAAIYVRVKQERAIELYNEILVALNKDSKVCHQDALDAAVALSTIHYETRQWKSAQSVFSLLWNTVTGKAKEYGMREEFVQSIYKKYTDILENETQADYATLRELAVQYRKTTTETFGATSESAMESTLILADINSKNEKHQQEAITLYEEAFKHSEKTTTTNRSLLTLLSSARTRLSTLYMSNATTSTANTEKATTLYKEQYERSKTSYGYSHHTTLDSMSGLVLLWTKSKKTENITAATKELETSTVSIINNEKDSKALYDSANTLAKTYTEAGLVQKGLDLLAELRRQIIFRDYSKSSTTGVKVSENVDRSSYIFLSTFEEALYQRKTTFSVIMTALLTETVLYQQYRQQVSKSNRRIDLILLSGARLRAFLLKVKRVDQATVIEDETFELFLQALAKEIKTDRAITRRFFIIMLEELSKERHSAHLGNAACNGGNARVHEYLVANKFQEAYDLGLCVFQFVHAHKGYHHAGNIGSGFKLSLYMAGRGVPRATDEKLRVKMLELSRDILKDTLDACKTLKLEFVSMQLAELNDLVGLMGEQKNYTDLEYLLEQLWNSRHSQSSWSPSTVVSIGRRLVECRFAHGKRDSAIHLCQDVVYNLRHVWGPLDKTTIEMSNLLSELLTTAGRHAEAMAVHENILREEVGEDNEAPVNAESAQVVHDQLELMRRTHARLGKFDKDDSIYKDLYQEVAKVFGKEKSFQGAADVSSWNAKDSGLANDTRGTFISPTSWEIANGKTTSTHKNAMHKRRSSGMAILLNGGIKAGS